MSTFVEICLLPSSQLLSASASTINRLKLEGTRENAYLRQVKRFKHLNITTTNFTTPKTKKGEKKGRAASLQREGKVTAGVAACAVGVMTSLPL